MFTLFKSLTLRQALFNQAPVLIASLAIAEMFYKFHSFLLESLAFLATWFVLDLVVSVLFGTLAKKPDAT
ncbi:hypothetical protein GGD81_003178 [Rhodobium orientis]|uniref:Uncharacterized protein n=1 Tax=Rhodobium orientis TaxID=34017 RepID=A0A327JHU0_9HYPH|nr:hypothetical protein [Rhodobium orientis]MBB4304122.1 hypothetical protein [Rhodobium orientis]MBK5948631.1 hypothetical protein [Rhodobium orientis]RAI24894.1 hypothetical protein CH339_20700 [Rhodobium orientis]